MEALIGKTVEEANELLREVGWFVVDEKEQVRYPNSVVVKLNEGKIIEVINFDESKDC